MMKKNKNDPAAIVIFGGTGDLSKKKLFPALFHLYTEGFLPDVFRIIGVSRKDLSDVEYRGLAAEAIANKKNDCDKTLLDKFLKNVFYKKGCSGESCTYEDLSSLLLKFDKEESVCMNKLFYLSVPPSSYEDIFRNLAASGLNVPCGDGEGGWARVLIEKPFGNDLESAMALDKQLTSFFREEQIFRIDHYLAKDAIQNILTFRFSNLLFEGSWKKENIEKIHIKLYEKIGVEDRGAFYDANGALRDVGQNHLLQMLALVAMENPKKLDAIFLREEKNKILESLKIYNEKEAEENTVRCRYEGYENIDGVAKDSITETYFRLNAFIENDRWRGVPFVLESGKSLGETKTEITVYFKPSSDCVCGDKESHEHKNILNLEIQPNQKVEMKFWVKKPGIVFKLEPHTLSFEYDKEKNGMSRIPDAYEKVLFDCIVGDQTLFASSREVEAAWKFIDPILKAWRNNKPELCVYKKGEMPKIHQGSTLV